MQIGMLPEQENLQIVMNIGDKWLDLVEEYNIGKQERCNVCAKSSLTYHFYI